MNKKLLGVILLTAALAGCGGNWQDQVEIFPGQEQVMVGMCTPNGGFVRGYMTESNTNYYKSTTVQMYRTSYHVECGNGAKIDKTLEKNNPQ
jgi:hypothetical protein